VNVARAAGREQTQNARSLNDLIRAQEQQRLLDTGKAVSRAPSLEGRVTRMLSSHDREPLRSKLEGANHGLFVGE